MRWESTAGASSAAAPAEVWGVLLDGRRWSEWNPGVEWMVIEGPVEPGTLLTMKPKGVRQTAFRVEAAEPERLLALVVTVGPVASLRLRWELARQAGGSAIVQTVLISGPLAGPLLGRVAHRIAAAMPSILERLAARAVQLGADPSL
ncbi:MAG TPA: SRPBCC family protein [Candidatus Elarobacter sp.]|nr:SRPBCC family protein [Candidatus Elarobacter sp.]